MPDCFHKIHLPIIQCSFFNKTFQYLKDQIFKFCYENLNNKFNHSAHYKIMEEIEKQYIFQKNRDKTHQFFKQNLVLNQMQNDFINLGACYNHNYFSNLSSNDQKEDLQLISGRTKDSYNFHQPNSTSKNSQPQFLTSFSNSIDPSPTLKPRKNVKDDIFLDFNNICFSNFSLFKNLPKFGKVTILSLQNCCLCSIPKELQTLPKELVSLDLSHNYLTKIHPSCSWKKLRRLNVGFNWIHEWPIIFERDKFETLEYLNFHQNLIETAKIAPKAACFKSLKYLIFSNNLLNSFPQWIYQCPELTALSLGRNRWIKDLDLSLLMNLQKLAFIDIVLIQTNAGLITPSKTMKLVFSEASVFNNGIKISDDESDKKEPHNF